MDDTDDTLYPFFSSPLKFARVSKQLIGEATLWFINFWNLRLQETFCLCLYLRQCPLDDIFLPLVVAPIKPSPWCLGNFCCWGIHGVSGVMSMAKNLDPQVSQCHYTDPNMPFANPTTQLCEEPCNSCNALPLVVSEMFGSWHCWLVKIYGIHDM